MRRKILNKDIFYLFNSNILSKLLLFSGQLFVAGLLNPTSLGELKSSLAYIEIFSVISILGLNTAVLSASNICQDRFKNDEIAQNALTFAFIFSLFLSGIIFFYLNIVSVNNNIVEIFIKFIWLLPLLSITSVLTSYLQSLQRFKEIMVLTVIPKVISIFILIISTYKYAVDGYIYGYYLGVIISTIFIILPFRKLYNEWYISMPIIKRLLSIGGSAMLSNLVGIISVNIGLIFLNFNGGDKGDIGQYSFALLIYFGCEVITQTVQQYFLPKYCQNKNNLKEWVSLVKESERIFVVVSFVVTILLVSISLLIWYIFPGFKYNHALLLLVFMSIIWLFSSFYSLRGASFISLGLTNINLKASMIMFIINMPLSYFLILKFHIDGALMSRFIIVLFNIIIIRLFFNGLLKDRL